MHVGALALALAAALVAASLRGAAGRASSPRLRLGRQRAAQAALRVEHLALLAGLLAGLALMRGHGWGFAHPRWLSLKLGLVASLLMPLELMHAWAAHVWIAQGLCESRAGGEPRRLERGLALEAMIRTLQAVVLVPALGLIAWLSVRRPL